MVFDTSVGTLTSYGERIVRHERSYQCLHQNPVELQIRKHATHLNK